MKYKEVSFKDWEKPPTYKIYLKIEDDGSQSVSCSEDNPDFKEWVAEGNTAEAAD
tara:strand:+ start:379 stop:543 length:165 start_codon:yes stop_codon:yes gene_type:complete